jgi:hypothetical protein
MHFELMVWTKVHFKIHSITTHLSVGLFDTKFEWVLALDKVRPATI